MASMIVAPYDSELDDIERQQLYADALRKKSLSTEGQVIGGVYIPKNPWANFLESFAGSAIGAHQNARKAELEQQQLQQRQDWLNRMPTTSPDVSPEVYGREMTGWGVQAPRGMEGIQGRALIAAMEAPAKEAARMDNAALRETLARMNQAGKIEQIERKAEVDAPYRLTFDQRQQLAADRAERAASTAAAKQEVKREAKLGSEMKALDFYEKRLDSLAEAANEVLKAPGLGSATGLVGGSLPKWAAMNPQQKTDAVAYIKNLQEKMQTIGLQELKAAGISPGSVTEREWGKFAAMIGNIDPTLGTENFKREVNRVLDQVKADREQLKADREALQAGGGAGKTVVPVKISSEAEWQNLTPGTRYVTPDGKIGVR